MYNILIKTFRLTQVHHWFSGSVDSGSYVVQETRNETDKDSNEEELPVNDSSKEESSQQKSPNDESPPPYTTDDEGKNEEAASEGW